jgi:hypothetical protein
MTGTSAPRSLPIEVRTRFERFPLAIKGAFVMRGADGNPHAVRILEGAVARVPSGGRHPFAVEDRLMDVAPNRDLFVPFEAPVNDLPSAWYAITSSVEVDGGRPLSFSSKAFTVPWPRTEVRRGTVRVERTADIEGASVRVVRVEMGGESATVVWRRVRGGPAPVTVALVANGRPLEVLPPGPGTGSFGSADEEHERLRTYPVPRAARSLEVLVQVRRGGAVSLPVSLA